MFSFTDIIIAISWTFNIIIITVFSIVLNFLLMFSYTNIIIAISQMFKAIIS